MKKIMIGCLLAVLILSFQTSWSQGRSDDRAQRLKTELNLSDEQATQIQKILTSGHEKMKVLKATEFKSDEESHQAFKSQKQATDKEIEAVLTPEQQQKFKELKKGNQTKHRQSGHQRHGKSGDYKELRTKVEAYKDENIKPVMLKQRAKLEPKISKKDKKTIAELRLTFEKMKEEKQSRFHQRGKSSGTTEPKKEMREEMKTLAEESHQKLIELVEKYKGDIQPLFDEVADQQVKWEEDLKKIAESTLKMEDGMSDEKVEKMKQKHGYKLDKMKMSRFLLLDPNEANAKAAGQSLVTNIDVFPNPASTVTTLKYEVKEAGEVTVELQNNRGKLLQTLKKSFHEAGSHELTIPLEAYQSELLYLVVKDKKGVPTIKNIVLIR